MAEPPPPPAQGDADGLPAPQHALAWRRVLFDDAPDAVFALDGEGRLLEANAAFARLVGRSLPEAMALRPWDWDIDHPEPLARALLARDVAVEDSFESRWRRADGTLRLVQTRLHRLQDGAGRLVVGSSRDVTDQRQHAQALRTTEQRLSLVMATAGMGAWDWDIATHQFSASPEVWALLGQRPVAHLPVPQLRERLLACMQPDDMARVSQAACTTLTEGVTLAVESRYLRPDGQPLWLSATGVLQHDEAGAPVRLVGALQDITAQREAQARLARELLQRRELVEQSKDGMLVLDEHSRVLEANPAMAAMLGRPLASLPGMSASDLGLELPPPATLHGAPGKRLTFDVRVPRGGAGPLQLEVSASAVVSDGRVMVFSTWRDVTQRKQAEAALRDSEHRLAAALMASGMGVWEWDLPSGQVRWSAFTALCLGRDPARQGDDSRPVARVLAWVHRDDRAAVAAAQQQATQGSGQFHGEFRVRGYDRRLRWVRLRGVLERSSSGQPLRVTGALLDVSDQHALRQRLLDDATRRRVMIEQSRDGVVVLNTDGSVDEANQAFAQMLGYTVAETLQLRVWDWEQDLSRERLLQMLAVSGQSSGTLQVRMRRRDGSTISAEVSTTGLVLGGRQVFFCVCRDVTQRLATETALRESEVRHRAAFDNSAVGMAENALDGTWMNVNPRLCEITGYSRQALMALRFSDLTHPGDRIDHWALLRPLLRGEQASTRRETRYVRQDGSTIWVAASTSAVRGADGRARYFLSVVEDITGRKRIEAELAGHRQHLEAEVAERTRALQLAMRARIESEHFLRSVADNIPDMVGYWDRQRVLRFANRPYRDWFAPGQDPVGQHRSALLRPDKAVGTERAFAAALAGQSQRFEFVLTNAAGEVRYTWVHYIPDRQGDQVAGLFVLVSDISEAKQAELRLQALNEQLVAARDRAEAANRAKSAFLANISHEIRTPMNAIIGLTHLMQRDAGAGPGAERLGKVSDAAHHLLDVINDVLDLSKIESGKLRLEQTDFPIDAVLARACALVADRARAKGLELVLQSDGVPSLLRGDPTRVSQALLNLMSNAVKFTDHGSVVLRCELMAADADALRLRFSVRDTGVGVPADKIDDLFNAFEQADTSTTRRFGGTGLGLAITRRLAVLMGGDVGVHTVQGQGSCFWFTARFQRAAQPVLADNTGLPGRRALVADDLPDARAALADLLRRLGMQVDSVEGGDEAVQAALQAEQRRRPYELLLLDADMPGTGGLAALQQLHRQLGDPGTPPCLLVVADEQAGAAVVGPGSSALQTLAKPVTLSALSAAIDRLDREPWRRPQHAASEALPNERALLERAAGHRVLLAEDNLVNQEVARELLQAVGLRVDLAADGQEAVGLAAQRDYDLVLMDMQMPVMDGLEATRALRTMPRHARTPILAMTANAFGDDRRACLAAGMDDHIAKPVDPELLYAMLCRWLPAVVVDEAGAAGSAEPPPAGAPVRLPADTGRAAITVGTAGSADHPLPARAPVSAPVGAAAAPHSPDFSGIPGLTMSRALLYLPGRDEIFARVLRQFTDQHGDGVPGLDDALRTGRWADARRMLHALRGACGAVGATAVQAEALALEQRLQALDSGVAGQQAGDNAPSAAAVQASLQALANAVRARLAAATVPPPVPATGTAVAPALGRLVDQLRRADFRAGAQFRELEPALREALGPAVVQRLAQQLAQHDYEAALRAAEALLADLPASRAPAAAGQ